MKHGHCHECKCRVNEDDEGAVVIGKLDAETGISEIEFALCPNCLPEGKPEEDASAAELLAFACGMIEHAVRATGQRNPDEPLRFEMSPQVQEFLAQEEEKRRNES